MKSYSKSLLALLLFLASSWNIIAQDAKESASYKQEQSVYNLGLKYNDINIARTAIYNLIAIDPTDASLLDSLAYMYYEYQQYTSCLLVSLDILKINPDHLAALEMSGVCYEQLGLKDKALVAYESIYLRNNSVYTLYKVAVIQLDLGRHGESITNAGILLDKEETKETKVSFSTDNGQQQISLEAAVYNLKGLIESSQENKEAARNSFNEAIRIEPEFAMAKDNLANLDK